MHNKFRVSCIRKSCRDCKNSCMVKEDFFGDKLYVCPAFNKKHKEVDAEKCNMFRCKDKGKWALCSNCTGGD